MISKKAQSEIITTVLIILLVLAAIVIVWQVVQGTLNKTKKQIENKDACIGVTLEIAKATGSATANAAQVTITRKPGADDVLVSNVTILINSVTAAKIPVTTESLAVYESKTWNVTMTTGQKVQAAAKLSSGVNCDPTAEGFAA